MDAHVGGFGEPAHRHLVQMLERGEGAAIQQVRFHILKRSLDFAFRLRTMRPAGPWLKTVMGGESEKAGVIDGLVAVVTGHHHLHVVVETGRGQSLEVFEGADMFADGGGEVLRLHKAQILAARVTQHITESMHPPPAFGRERNVVRRIIHLSLHAGTGLEPLHRRFRRVRPHGAQMFLHDAVAALKAQPAQFFMQADGGQIRVAFQQLRDPIRVRVQQARPARTFAFRFSGPGALVFLQHAVHALAVDSQLPRDGSLRSAGIVQADDLVARGFLHAAVFISPTRSRLSAATEAASRDSFSKRGARIARSSGVSPARP